ncbi:MAG: peroxiredoxin [Zetaproteobacteria bacterium]|nr:peroxiredoxin [Zetaproteobacteria bacterium]
MTILLGDVAPDFQAQTTEGPLSFHEWIGDTWCILFSHPKNFTPVCTTELGEASRLKEAFLERNCKLIGLSIDSVADHHRWAQDIQETQGQTLNIPLIADHDCAVASAYDMLHPSSDTTFTVRCVFVIDPFKKVRLMLTYPASTGRNFAEILRVLDSLQLTDAHSVATPVNWLPGEEVVILPTLTDPAVLQQKFPQGYKEIKPYLRTTPCPAAGT